MLGCCLIEFSSCIVFLNSFLVDLCLVGDLSIVIERIVKLNSCTGVFAFKYAVVYCINTVGVHLVQWGCTRG